ncbi:FAD/NAD(P)-binding protein [Haliangium sp.]|uniref:FAD/NAD(P)-binding protein n=1 Tax=Haliangium sp. TaxID=2663208 RepID=UPI003D13A05E
MPAPTPPRAAPEGDQDPLVPVPARVVATVRESEGVVTLHVDPPAGYRHRPGQFNMLSLPGVGDVPISISGVIGGAPGATPSEIVGGTLEHTIRAVGAVSEALVHLRPGATLGLRGPFGTSWPVDDILTTGRPAVVIAGGIGLAPLRGTIRLLLDHPEQVPPVRLMYGARTPADILFDQEMLGWGPGDRARVSVTVDRGSPTWTGNVGVVTRLMRRKDLPRDGLYLVCGPEIMMRFVIDTLIDIGVPETSIYLSMERNMKCAAGFCGRCQYGPYFVCKDGPVFRYDQVSFLFGQSGF